MISCLALFASPVSEAATVNVSSASQLVNEIELGAAGDTILVAAETYELTASLKPKANMVIQAALQMNVAGLDLFKACRVPASALSIILKT